MDSTTPTAPTSTPTTAAPSAPSSSAAPATSAPAGSSTPVQRPTFEQVFAQDAAASPETTATPDGTAPTEPSAADPALDSAPAQPGEPPKWRWQDILTNAREESAKAAREEFQRDYGWAMSTDRQAVEPLLQMGRQYSTDPIGFAVQIVRESAANPRAKAAMVAELQSLVGSQSPTPAPMDMSPDIPVMDANGQIVAQTFSAEKVQQIVSHAIQQALEKEVGPMKQDFQTRQDRETAMRAEQELQTQVQDIYSDSKELPGFAEHEAEIAKVFATIPSNVPPDRALRMAWKQVVGQTLANRDQVKADQIRELQTKAAASSVNPAAASIPATKRPTSFHDASLKWA